MLTWLGLLAATSASAECAWVLWVAPLNADNPGRWEPDLAYQTSKDCQRASDLWNEWNHNPKNRNALIETRCLPDTVDPRGPKSSQR